MTLIQMNAQQMRAKAIKNMEERRQREKEYEQKVHSMSAHDVGSYYDIRAIKNSKQFKEQKVYFDADKVMSEFEDMMTHNRLITKKENFLDHLKSLGHSQTDAHSLRLWTRIIDEIVGDVKLAYEIKD